MLSMPPPLDYQHPVGGQQMPPAVPASVTSSALEAELMSSDDESLERLLASAKVILIYIIYGVPLRKQCWSIW